MKKAINAITFFFIFQWCFGQDAESVMTKYKASIAKIQTLSYEINRVDTFVSGNAWNISGYCHFRREPDNKLFGFNFLAKRKDVPQQAWYDGQYFFSINHELKNFNVDHNPGRYVLGHPGGQMVSPDFFVADTGYTTMSVTDTQEQYILRLQFPDIPEHGITNKYKLLYLDKKSYFPQKIFAHHEAGNDAKQVTVLTFSNLLINDPKSEEQFTNKEFLASYELMERAGKNELETLVGKDAPGFTLQTFSGQSVNLQKLKGKLVLLDFWEVWCTPCVQSMPKVQAMHEKYGGKGLVVLGVSLDKNIASSKSLAERKKLTFANLLGNEETKKGYKVVAVPEYILIDKTGKIILAQAGFSEDIEKIIIEKLGS